MTAVSSWRRPSAGSPPRAGEWWSTSEATKAAASASWTSCRAYRLQDDGLDTVDANVELGLPVDARDFAVGAAILADLGAVRVRLLTNNPAKPKDLERHGITVVAMEPLVIDANEHNTRYLSTKRDRLGHALP